MKNNVNLLLVCIQVYLTKLVDVWKLICNFAQRNRLFICLFILVIAETTEVLTRKQFSCGKLGNVHIQHNHKQDFAEQTVPTFSNAQNV